MMLNGWLKNTKDMENNFNFKSQICTTREQSERLLALGLKEETADCAIYYSNVHECDRYINKVSEIERDEFPAWSLHRLLSLIEYNDGFIDVSLREGRYSIHYGYDDEWYDNLYDAIISCIETLIEEKDFNKEYLV